MKLVLTNSNLEFKAPVKLNPQTIFEDKYLENNGDLGSAAGHNTALFDVTGYSKIKMSFDYVLNEGTGGNTCFYSSSSIDSSTLVDKILGGCSNENNPLVTDIPSGASYVAITYKIQNIGDISKFDLRAIE